MKTKNPTTESVYATMEETEYRAAFRAPEPEEDGMAEFEQYGQDKTGVEAESPSILANESLVEPQGFPFEQRKTSVQEVIDIARSGLSFLELLLLEGPEPVKMGEETDEDKTMKTKTSTL